MGKNEVDDANVYYYPTVRLYPADNKFRPWDYDKGFDSEELIKFIKRFATA